MIVLFQSFMSKAMKNFEIFKPVTLLRVGVNLLIFSVVICKSEKVLLARKSNKFDRLH